MKDAFGIYAVTATPFTAQFAIDYDTAEKHIDWLLNSGVHGLIPLGATGEFSALSIEERKEYARFVMTHVAGRVPVIVGAVASRVRTTVDLAEHAAELGAAGVMVLPPPGLHLSQNEVYEYYASLDERLNLPIMVYNNPGSSGVDILPDTLQKIAQLKNIAALKESTGLITRLTRAVDELADDLTVFCGCESLAFESFVMGAKAWVCVLANVAPTMAVTLYQLIKGGQLSEARNLYRRVLPLLRLFEESGELWQIVKYMTMKRGFGTGVCRPPRLALSEEIRLCIDSLLESDDYQ